MNNNVEYLEGLLAKMREDPEIFREFARETNMDRDTYYRISVAYHNNKKVVDVQDFGTMKKRLDNLLVEIAQKVDK